MDFQKAKQLGGFFCAILLTTGLLSHVALADESITGQGSASVEVIPTETWMGMTLTGQGTGMAAALNDLNARFREASKKLESLGAEKGSIQLGMPTNVIGANSMQPVAATTVWSSDPVAVPARAAYPSSGPVAVPAAPSYSPADPGPGTVVVAPSYGPPGATPVKPMTIHRVSATLIAGWKLPEGGPQKVLLFVTDLNEKLEAADLFGEKNAAARKAKLSPEEQEILEEMQPAGANPYSGGAVMMHAVRPNRFSFVYAGEVSADQRRKVLREAFERAHRNARELAEAAGVRLGSLGSLYEDQVSFSGPYFHTSVSQTMNPEQLKKLVRKQYKDGKAHHEQVIGLTIGGLSYSVDMNTTFKIRN